MITFGACLAAAALIAATGIALIFGMEPFSDCDRGDRMTDAIAARSSLSIHAARWRGGVVGRHGRLQLGHEPRVGGPDDPLPGPDGPKHSEQGDLDVSCFDRRHQGFDRTISLTWYVPKASTADGQVVHEVDVIISLHSAIGLSSTDLGCD